MATISVVLVNESAFTSNGGNCGGMEVMTTLPLQSSIDGPEEAAKGVTDLVEETLMSHCAECK